MYEDFVRIFTEKSTNGGLAGYLEQSRPRYPRCFTRPKSCLSLRLLLNSDFTAVIYTVGTTALSDIRGGQVVTQRAWRLAYDKVTSLTKIAIGLHTKYPASAHRAREYAPNK